MRQALRSKNVSRDLFRNTKRAGGNLKNERRFPFHVKSGLSWGSFFEPESLQNSWFFIGFRRISGVPHRPRLTSFWEASWRLLGMILGGFWDAKIAPKRAQDGAKMAPRRPKMAPRRPKMAPRRPNEGPRRLQDGPRRLQEARETPQEAPVRIQQIPRGCKKLPRHPKSLQETSETLPGDPKRLPRSCKIDAAPV